MKKKLESDLTSEVNTYIVFDGCHYLVIDTNTDTEVGRIHFQEGTVKDAGVNGVFIEDMINICINRLDEFQATDLCCRENATAKTKLEESLMWLRKRTTNRKRRGVEGTYKK
jgi:hypothetical protein